jgi:flagellar protein FlaI
VEGALKRLTSPPINLSPTLIESLDIIIVMSYARERGKSARRIKEITEVVSVDPKTGETKLNLIYRWDPVKDSFIKVNESFKLGKIASERGTTLERVNEEISRRVRVLEWMLKNGIKSYKEVSKFISEYYLDPLKFLEMTEKPAERVQERVIKKSSFASLLEMLGFKVVGERK